MNWNIPNLDKNYFIILAIFVVLATFLNIFSKIRRYSQYKKSIKIIVF